ncbi:FAD-binding oxidoreductase [Mesorhizobium sp. J8]|uniref:FAD-binding oxidoreductase n=1 Tax=Mesorhizobium sp. J8 TaxID=2777475 RepID=UPI0019163D4C|nr:FAD-binding oxidoreductase [Mesorhizobium sp. J8]BCM20757.1 putative FAD-linked oxidoreductase [Mesorhizobium sp. J8]
MDNRKLASFYAAMGELLGGRGWSTDPSDLAAHGRDWLDRYGHPPLGVARPASTGEVAAVVRLCGEHRVTITPQGGNTGLNGGSVLNDGQVGIVLSLARMNRILAIDPVGLTATVEAGVVLGALHDELAGHGLALPLHLGAEGSARIGGLIGTNAGGSHAMRHGMMQDLVLGMEVVLPDGEVWDGARALIKDNAGYQLRKLFCGAEGTLGVVTRAVLRLSPLPIAYATALLALPDLEAALRVGAFFRARTGDLLTAIEFFGEIGLALALKHVEGLDRLIDTPGPTYLLVELATSVPDIALDTILENALAAALEDGTVLDGVMAASKAQRASLWRLREEMPEGQRLEGVQIKHDVSVPVARLAAFIDEASRAAERVLPGVRINPFGHLGDGNVHFNLSPAEGSRDFAGRDQQLSEAIYDVVTRHNGSMAAEHGLGQAKVALADGFRSPVERALMRGIKAALDPRSVMNPGKVV